MMRLLAVFLLADVIFAAGAPAETIQELRTGGIRSLVRVGATDEASVVADALNLLGSPDVTLGRLVVYASRSAARAVEKESRLDHCSWDALRMDLKSNAILIDSDHCPEVSEVIKIGSSILLRTVDLQCRSIKKLLRGTSDPLRIHSLGAEHEGLAVSIHAGSSGVPFVHLFVRTESGISTDLAKDILLQLKSIAGVTEVGVVVRDDTNFVCDCTFPSPYLFDGPASVRTFESEKDQRGGEATCVALDPWPVQCWAFPRVK
jgi:hypothetical protein